MPGGAGAEGFASQHRDALLIQQALAEGLGAEPGGADIDHDEHAAIGFQRPGTGAIGQAVAHQVPALAIGLGHLLQLRQGLFQGHHGGVLDEFR